MALSYTPRTDAQLEQLAWDIVAGKVFHSLYHGEEITKSGLSLASIFIPLIFISQAELEAWIKEHNITAFYEYMDKAGPRSCNGMPGFFSMNVLSEADGIRLHERVHAVWQIQKQRMEGTNNDAGANPDSNPTADVSGVRPDQKGP